MQYSTQRRRCRPTICLPLQPVQRAQHVKHIKHVKACTPCNLEESDATCCSRPGGLTGLPVCQSGKGCAGEKSTAVPEGEEPPSLAWPDLLCLATTRDGSWRCHHTRAFCSCRERGGRPSLLGRWTSVETIITISRRKSTTPCREHASIGRVCTPSEKVKLCRTAKLYLVTCSACSRLACLHVCSYRLVGVDHIRFPGSPMLVL